MTGHSVAENLVNSLGGKMSCLQQEKEFSMKEIIHTPNYPLGIKTTTKKQTKEEKKKTLELIICNKGETN